MHPDAALVEPQTRVSCPRASDPKQQPPMGGERDCVPLGLGPLDYTFYVQIAGVYYNRDPLPQTSAFSPARRML